MKTIPQVRLELLDTIENANLDYGTYRKIKNLVKHLYRRKAIRRAKKESAEMTPALEARIKRFALANPNKSYKTIGNLFDVATGRVSEAVAGKRAA